MAEEERIRIIIADDFDILREVIHLYLELAPEMDVIDEAPDLDEALQCARSLQPDIILMNDYLPPIDSAHAAALFRDEGITIPILIISMHLEPYLIRRSLDNGANGFMHKDEIITHLLEAVRQVHQGDTYLSPKAEEALSSAEV